MGGCEVRKAHRNVRRAAHHVTFNVTQRALCCLGKCGRINPLRVLHEYSDVSIDAVCVECQRGAQRSQEYHCRYAAHSQSTAERTQCFRSMSGTRVGLLGRGEETGGDATPMSYMMRHDTVHYIVQHYITRVIERTY
jgi:hypothetical protein